MVSINSGNCGLSIIWISNCASVLYFLHILPYITS